MKKVYLIFIVLILFLTSCSFGGENVSIVIENDESIADNTFKKVIDAINSHNDTQLKLLFSKTTQGNTENLEKNATNFIKFIQGDIVAFSEASEAGVGADYKTEHKKRQKVIQSAFHIQTSEKKYYLAIKECTKDDFDNKNVGVMSIYIINAENWKEDYVYRGDGKWNPGINIDILAKSSYNNYKLY